VSDVAHVLNTPLPAVGDMEWTEVLAWHEQAVRIVKAKAGIL
jgi:hypothetical protein